MEEVYFSDRSGSQFWYHWLLQIMELEETSLLWNGNKVCWKPHTHSAVLDPRARSGAWVVMVPLMKLTENLHCHQTSVTQEIQCGKGWSLSAHDSRIFQEQECSQKRPREFPCPQLMRRTSARTEDGLSLRETRLSNYGFPHPLLSPTPHFHFLKRMS